MEELAKIILAEFHEKLTRLTEIVERDAEFPTAPDKIKVAIGMRRSGKTYFLYQKILKLLASGVDKRAILYVNFEDDRLLPLDQKKLASIANAFYSLFPENHDRRCYPFFDEIQNVQNWPLVIRRLHDSKNAEIFLTGSSAKMLSKEISTSLRGRSLAIEIWPYSFLEFLRAKKISFDGALSGQKTKDLRTQAFHYYLSEGGFPEITSFAPEIRQQTLQEYLDVAIFRDIIERHNIKHPTMIKYLILSLVHTVGKPFSVNKFYNDVKSQGYQIGKDILYDYVGHVEDAYLAFPISLYDKSLRKRQANPKKLYGVDPGMIRALTLEYENDLGRLFENIVFFGFKTSSLHDPLLYYSRRLRGRLFSFRPPRQKKAFSSGLGCLRCQNFRARRASLKSCHERIKCRWRTHHARFLSTQRSSYDTKDLMLKKKGETYRGFSVTKVIEIEELKCTLLELVHEKTGASVMHIHANDAENLFCLSFKTLPSSSNGAAHILEHTVLCGSKKYPVKDPFFAMTRRSLNTFMNALTGSDFTCYPAASQVEKDFYNLLDVYLDAVFHPELKEVSFLQEGHRLEFQDPKNPKTPLEYKGIVFNEMKGNLTSADSRLWHTMLSLLFPHLPYGYNSGGDPKEIPQLTYKELLAFHETYYHPSRCLFFFYGNLPLEKHLDFIAKKTLDHAPKAAPLASIPLQPRFKAPKEMETYFPINEGEELDHKTIIAFGWVTMPIVAQEELLALCILDSILMDTDASLLKHKLLESKLCIHADAFMDIEMSEVPYMIVCKGCEKEKANALQTALLTSLEEIAKEGIPQRLIDTAIHQLEIARTEISGEGSPFGLTLFMRSGLAKQHGCPPENALVLHALFVKLIQNTKDPHYLPKILRKFFLDNPHRVRLTMLPDPQLAKKEAQEERDHLDRVQKNLTQNKIDDILKQTEKLEAYRQETSNQSLDCLPKVGLADVPLTCQHFPLHRERLGNLELFHHDCFTNQMLYADLVFDLPFVEEEELPYVQLLASLFTELGAQKRDYRENLEYIQAHTGGLHASLALHVESDEPAFSKPSFTIRGKALYRKADKLFSLMNELALQLRFDEKARIVDLILQLDTSLQNRFNRNALKYALQEALSGFSTPLRVSHILQGLPYYKTIQQLAKSAKKSPEKIIEKLSSLYRRIFQGQTPHLVISCDQALFKQIVKENAYGLANLPLGKSAPWKESFSPYTATSHARPISSPVAFTVEAFPSIHYLHPHAPALSCAMPLFENTILLRKIREEGGAYGTGASFNPTFGNFYFHAYRDPKIASSLSTFHFAIEQLAQGQFDEQDLEEAKLSVIQAMDHPVPPGSRALAAYNLLRDGKSYERRMRYRETLLALTKKQLIQAIGAEILAKKDQGVVVSFGSRELLEKENLLLGKKALPILSL